jgi:hypothetical protein
MKGYGGHGKHKKMKGYSTHKKMKGYGGHGKHKKFKW